MKRSRNPDRWEALTLRTVRAKGVLLVVTGLLACDLGDSAIPSAGPDRVLAPEPITRIGSLEGDPAYLFNRIGVGRLSADGQLFVSDGSEIREFGRDGVHIRTLGRSGEGPGEFEAIHDLVILDSALLVVDWWNRRLTRFGRSGLLESTSEIEAPVLAGSPGWVGLTTDPVHPVLRYTENLPRGVVAGGDRYIVEQIHETVVIASGTSVDTLISAPGTRNYLSVIGSTAGVGSERLGPRNFFATGSGFVASASAHRDTLKVLRAGEPPLSLPLGIPTAAVDDASREALRADMIGDLVAERRQQMEQAFREIAWPDSMPRIGYLKVDSEDRLWVREFRIGDGPSRWFIYDLVAGYRANIVLPAEATFLDSRGDEVLISTSDELGVPYVEIWSVLGGLR